METEKTAENLMDGLMYELNRNRELLQAYKDIGPAGSFGAHFIQQSIAQGENAVSEVDVVKMISAYKKLKDSR